MKIKSSLQTAIVATMILSALPLLVRNLALAQQVSVGLFTCGDGSMGSLPVTLHGNGFFSFKDGVRLHIGDYKNCILSSSYTDSGSLVASGIVLTGGSQGVGTPFAAAKVGTGDTNDTNLSRAIH